MRLDQVVADDSITPHLVSETKLLFLNLFQAYFKLQILIRIYNILIIFNKFTFVLSIKGTHDNEAGPSSRRRFNHTTSG
jgi:hypothetical protein